MERSSQNIHTKPIKSIIFDLDGTLVDSIHDIHLALDFCCKQFNIKTPSKKETRHYVGPGAEQLIQATVNGTNISVNTFYDTFRSAYRTDYISQTQCYDGMIDLLKELKHASKKLAILTNKPEDASRYLLENLNILDLFEAVIGPDTYDSAKPNPKGLLQLIDDLGCTKNECVFIGDTPTDIRTARAALVPSIAICHGYGSKDVLEKENPTHIIDDCTQLRDFLISLD